MFKSKTWLTVLASALVLSLYGPAGAQDGEESDDRFVTVGVFMPEGDDYRHMEQFDLEFDRGVPCHVWSRTAGGDKYNSEEHLHYNAAGEMSYDGETFAWTEYGPEHTEMDAAELCANKKSGVGVPKEVNWTDYYEEQHGDRDPYYLKIVGVDACPTLEHRCVDVGEYQGINAVPAVTMQILPSSAGDTVTNDAEYPPGKGEKVVVGFWEHPEDYDPGKDENPCAGEPTLKIAYPLEYGAETCYGWKHWTSKKNEDGTPSFNENSAKKFSCSDNDELHLTQWTTMDCTRGAMGAGCMNKTASRTHCCRDNPPTIWSQILSGCEKKP